MAQFRIDPSAACIDGHFPDQPLVPGVVIVDRVIHLITAADGVRIDGIRRVKFPGPLLPGQTCEVDWRQARRARIRFTCQADKVEVAVGTLITASDGEDEG
ncbi:hypothetical protein HKX42_00645 [Salinisphaera sp. USBA-960]|nr:hypothetical protein [Salifodinibacter halophilus]NNC25392.1 hypothetical protein [Salifodinibacter halophilus]